LAHIRIRIRIRIKSYNLINIIMQEDTQRTARIISAVVIICICSAA